VPTGLKRIHDPGHLHYVTFSCYRRLPLLGSERAKNLFVRELARVRREYKFWLVGYVVMPEHVHLMLSEPPDAEVSTALKMLKQRVSWKMRRRRKIESAGQLRLEFSEDAELRSFWQARYYDFNVYKKYKMREKLRYMHANPVVRGLVRSPGDWPWSSWGFYEKGEVGLVPIDVSW
jgi:putative transposase